MHDPAQGDLGRAGRPLGFRVEEFGQGIEVILGEHLEQFLEGPHRLPDPARNRQGRFVEDRQLRQGELDGVAVEQIEELETLASGNRRAAQGEELSLQFGAAVAVGPAMGQASHSRMDFDVLFGELARGVVRHGKGKG